MHVAKLNIVHKGCWGSDIGLCFPTFSFSSVDCRWVKGNVVHILRCQGDATLFSSITAYLEKRKDVLSLEELSCDDHELYLRVVTSGAKKKKQFSDIFFENDCFPMRPTFFEGKFEKWTLGSTKRENIETIYAALRKEHEVTLVSVTTQGIQAELTQKQREALMYAKHFGYFSWPRKKTATEIAQLLGVPKTVFLSHLRKAENKVLSGYLGE